MCKAAQTEIEQLRETISELEAERDRLNDYADKLASKLSETQAERDRLQMAVRDFFVYLDGAPIAGYHALSQPPKCKECGRPIAWDGKYWYHISDPLASALHETVPEKNKLVEID